MDRMLYANLRNQLMRRRTFPFIMHNEPLAKEFFAEFNKEVPTAKLYIFPRTDVEVRFQAITHDQRAEDRLWERIKSREDELSKAIMALSALREEIEKSIETGNTKLPKKQKSHSEER